MNIRHFMRMALWAKNPPSVKRAKFIAAILVACLALYAVEYFVGWPDWLTPNATPKGRIFN